MIDASLPVEYERFDRMQAVIDGRESLARPLKTGARARLTAEEAAARSEEANLQVSETMVVSPVPAAPVAAADPEAALRYARLGFVAAAVLVLLLVWVMQRKKGG